MSFRSVPELAHAFGNVTVALTQIIPPLAGKRVCIYAMILTNGSGNSNWTLQDTSGANISQQFQLAADEDIRWNVNAWNGDPWWVTPSGLGVQLAQTGTIDGGYDLWYMYAT